jgi:acyl-CoA thioester hydrolase
MPPRHTSEFRVHVFDLDAWGAIRTNVLLRFLQQAASDASAAAGFDIEWYERTGTLWVVRRTIIDYLAAAAYRDVLEVRTWVSDLRRVRSQREYEVWRPADATLVARAATDWVYVDTARARAGAAARGHAPAAHGRRRRPTAAARAAAAPPSHAAELSRRVELAEIDSVVHVNNAHYAVYVEQAVYDALAAHGWRVDPAQRRRPADGGAPRPRVLRGSGLRGHLARHRLGRRCHRRRLRNGMHPVARWDPRVARVDALAHAPDGAPASLGAAVAALSG